MEIGQTITIGRMGQQPMHIADTSVDPQHAKLTRTGTDTYQIEDLDSTRGTFVFGMRIKRKTVKTDTPFFLGQHKTSVRQLLTDLSTIDLGQIWANYENEKKKWDIPRWSIPYVCSLPSSPCCSRRPWARTG